MPKVFLLEGRGIEGGNFANATAKPAMLQIDYFFWMWCCKETSNPTD